MSGVKPVTSPGDVRLFCVPVFRRRWGELLSASASGLRGWCFRRAPRTCLRFLRASRAELGIAGEELAARSLLAQGWRLRGRRLRTIHGEVDLWASARGVSLVVEVKTGRLRRLASRLPREGAWDLRWRPGASLGAAQQRRLFRAARILAARRHLRPEVALIEVLVSRTGDSLEVLRPRRMFESVRSPYTRPPR